MSKAPRIGQTSAFALSCCAACDLGPAGTDPTTEGDASVQTFNAHELERGLQAVYAQWAATRQNRTHPQKYAGNQLIDKEPGAVWRVSWWNIENLYASKCNKPIPLAEVVADVVKIGGFDILFIEELIESQDKDPDFAGIATFFGELKELLPSWDFKFSGSLTKIGTRIERYAYIFNTETVKPNDFTEAEGFVPPGARQTYVADPSLLFNSEEQLNCTMYVIHAPPKKQNPTPTQAMTQAFTRMIQAAEPLDKVCTLFGGDFNLDNRQWVDVRNLLSSGGFQYIPTGNSPLDLTSLTTRQYPGIITSPNGGRAWGASPYDKVAYKLVNPAAPALPSDADRGANFGVLDVIFMAYQSPDLRWQRVSTNLKEVCTELKLDTTYLKNPPGNCNVDALSGLFLGFRAISDHLPIYMDIKKRAKLDHFWGPAMSAQSVLEVLSHLVGLASHARRVRTPSKTILHAVLLKQAVEGCVEGALLTVCYTGLDDGSEISPGAKLPPDASPLRSIQSGSVIECPASCKTDPLCTQFVFSSTFAVTCALYANITSSPETTDVTSTVYGVIPGRVRNTRIYVFPQAAGTRKVLAFFLQE
eukprot:jgi/Botrbrau1/6526/Bobra.0034s0098.1